MTTIAATTANYLDLYGTGVTIPAMTTMARTTVACLSTSTYKFGSCLIFWYLNSLVWFNISAVWLSLD